jgi:hypothetical protein
MALAAGFLLWSGLFSGCSEDKKSDGTVGPEPSKITVEQIIFNPKSPAPGDTLQATAVVTSDTPNVGDFARYKWTASGGGFLEGDTLRPVLEGDQSSVLWVAPLQSKIYSLTVTAKNDVNTSSVTDDVFVGQIGDFITERAGELFPMTPGGALYYTSAPGGPDEGLFLRFKEGSRDEALFEKLDGGTQFSLNANLTQSAHVVVAPFPRRVTVVHESLGSRERTTIATDSLTFRARPNEFTRPSVSPNGQLICYQGSLLDQIAPPSQGGVDTFAVFVYDIVGQTTQRVTFRGHGGKPKVSNSFYPTVSTDNKHVVFVSDRGGPFVWELYALPITGTTVTPDTIGDGPARLSDTGGQMASGTTSPPAGLLQEWNPAHPILAVIGADNKLRLVPTGETGAVLVAAPGRVGDFCWAPNGQYLAASVFDPDAGVNKIHRVSMDGGYEEVSAALVGDKVADLSVSPGGEFLIYTIQRGSDVWYELIDMSGSSGTMQPVRITPAVAPGGAADYGPPLQSLRSAWRPASKVAYLFFLDEDTPKVMELDLSGIGQ